MNDLNVFLAEASNDDIGGWGLLALVAMLASTCFIAWLVFRD